MFDMTNSLSRHHMIPSASILATEDLCAVAKAVECAHKSGRLLGQTQHSMTQAATTG